MESPSPTYILSLRQQQIIRYCRVAPISIWVFDYFLTLDEEVRLMTGKGRWGITHVLYIPMRFFPPIGAVCGAYNALVTNGSLITCVSLYRTAEVILFFIMLTAEGMLLIRTMALWSHKKRVRQALIVIYVSLVIVILVCAIISTSLKFEAICEGSSSSAATSFSRVTLGMFLSSAFYELIILTLTILHGYMWRSSGFRTKSKIVSAVTQGNFVYTLSIFATSIANIAFFALPLSEGWNGILSNLQGVLHGAVASRILFNLRDTMDNRQDAMTFSMSRLQFAPTPNNATREDEFLI